MAFGILNAIDSVWNKSLISKLPSFSFPFCFENLHQFSFVIVNGLDLLLFSINSDVQGSIFSPTLFLFFISDYLSTNNSIHSYSND